MRIIFVIFAVFNEWLLQQRELKPALLDGEKAPQGGEFDKMLHPKIFEPRFLKKVTGKHISKFSGIKEDQNICRFTNL